MAFLNRFGVHRLLSLVVLLACSEPSAVEGSVSSEIAAPSLRSDVDVTALAAALESGVRLIDVRTPGEYASGHVPGAISVPMDVLAPDHSAVTTHPKDQPLYVICESGGRSARAADQLVRAGYRTMNVVGGTADWRRKGHKVD